MSLVVNDENFTALLRMLNTNVDGRINVCYALTRVKGIGRRFAILVCKKAGIPLTKRAGELTEEELEYIKTIVSNPLQFKIPKYFLNSQRDLKDGKYSQCVSNQVDTKLRNDVERMKKMRLHRGLRHYWQIRVRGQHTCTTGRRGKSVGGKK